MDILFGIRTRVREAIVWATVRMKGRELELRKADRLPFR